MHPVTRILFATCVALLGLLLQVYLRDRDRGPPPFA